MSSNPEDKDYLDQLRHIFPWHRSFTTNERIIIILFVSTFVSIVGCILFCLICSRFPLRRRYYSKKKLDKEQHILIASPSKKDTLVLPPPYYESIFKTDGRKLSNGTVSDTDGGQSSASTDYLSVLNEKIARSQPAHSSLSNGDTVVTIIPTYPSPPYAQINVEFNIDTTKNILIIHLTNGEHFSLHPAFDEQAEFFIHIQLLNNKILKKFHDARKKRRSSLQLSTWRKQQEKTTEKLLRTSSDILICNQYLQFELNKDNIKSTSLRFLLFCIDRSGIQDLMFESVIHLNALMIPHYQEIIEFKDLPEITFGEIFLGISYLPTAERFTIKVEKLRYLCKTEKDQKIGARLIVTFIHHGRRFFQKKLSSIISDESLTTNHNIHEINEIITQNIPQNDIQSIYVHFELIIRILQSRDESIISGGSILLGEHTRYESEWQKILEQPRHIHLGWYQFFG
ncbi:unnamed protein product [Rotaria sordida]|uniref:Uncharacterized protein n=1 Tax=Rotaria sordida TaxID=392033 RepID=A0A818UEJ3_9BILA|nr:unnamed protein product [Rotaria sordida]CAF1002831.1 unnamed protein product [Rotaria sordida]CAF3568995.1 unnamed protein product [Rotaria sordida]CAF3697296.1 unnamed protein product [Rotaria sordida]